MADQSIKCCFLLKGPLHSTEPQAISLVTVREFPRELREQWYEAIVEHDITTSNEGRHNFKSFILDPNGSLEVKYDPADTDTATSSADCVALSAALAALEGNDQMANLDPAEAIGLLHRIQQLGEHIPLPHILALNSFVLAARLHQSSKTAAIVGGIVISSLACATPAILGAVGFSAIGPVAESAAAAWQASMGSVVAGGLFSFLQSAAMGGAAMGVFTGIGTAGAVVAVAAGLASPERVGEVIETVRSFSEGVVNGVAEKVKGFLGWLNERKD
ncbi:MAG: hypothetical protein Q9195_004716 [Heterodermia aff. obscurata]